MVLVKNNLEKMLPMIKALAILCRAYFKFSFFEICFLSVVEEKTIVEPPQLIVVVSRFQIG